MKKEEQTISRRRMLGVTVGFGGLAMTGGAASVLAEEAKRTPTRMMTISAKPEPIVVNAGQTAVIVVDMQNDFGAEGGMFQRAGIDISIIKSVVAPTAKVLSAARKDGIKIIYLKMGFRADLSDAGGPSQRVSPLVVN